MDIIFERNTAEINNPYKKSEKKEPRDFLPRIKSEKL